MKRYLKNGFIHAALFMFGLVLLPELVAGQRLTVGKLVVDGLLLLLAVALALWGILAVRRMPPTEEARPS